ncbi:MULTISPECIES: amphi-Trp domain-containing protein [Natrialbaceae]|uniref:amphi-Trp domain-containing protein n=1 Tax=Natrialbaceae TaxID=1644061 RepID=UPI00207CD089|nr:amphi-Trp domain-containing protein [Natronococcus sp. CG52]
MADTLFELEHAYDRADLAEIFREFADALEDGTTVELHTAETRLSVDVPARVVAEIEAEHEEEITELEFELEWDDPDGTSVRVADPEGDESDGASESERVEISQEDGRRSRFEVYRDRADEWRWRLVHWNGNIIADSGEGYTSRSNAERAARGVMRNAPTARIERRDAS